MPRSDGSVRFEMRAEAANEVMELVRASHSTRSRVVSNAVHLYKKLSDLARDSTVVVFQNGVPIEEISMPWDEDWDGLPELVEDRELPHIPDPEAYRNRQHEESSSE